MPWCFVNGLLLWSFSRAVIQCAPELFTGISSTKGTVFGVGVLLFVCWCCHCCCLVSEGFLSTLSLGKGYTTPGHFVWFLQVSSWNQSSCWARSWLSLHALLEVGCFKPFPLALYGRVALCYFLLSCRSGLRTKRCPIQSKRRPVTYRGCVKASREDLVSLGRPTEPPPCGTDLWGALEQMFSWWHLRRLFRAPRTPLKPAN